MAGGGGDGGSGGGDGAPKYTRKHPVQQQKKGAQAQIHAAPQVQQQQQKQAPQQQKPAQQQQGGKQAGAAASGKAGASSQSHSAATTAAAGGPPAWASTGMGSDAPVRFDAPAPAPSVVPGGTTAHSSSLLVDTTSTGGHAPLAFTPLDAPLGAWRGVNGLSLASLLYDVTPGAFVDWIVCEAGVLTPDAVGAVLHEFAALEQAAEEEEAEGQGGVVEGEEDGGGEAPLGE